MSLSVSDICNDLKTFLESICRTCSRIDSGDGQMQFQRIFAEVVSPDGERDEKPPVFEQQPSEELKDVYEELLVWKLDIAPCDGLPQQICRDCLDRFRSVKHFRSLCLDTQKLLQSYINHVDTLLESGSLGRVSPKSESVKSEPRASPAPSSFNPEDLVEEVPETPERQQQGSPVSSPRSVRSQQSPRYHDAVYAESSLGTPPPLFEEIKTEPIDMETMEYLKAESELELEPEAEIREEDEEILHPFHFASDDDMDDDDGDTEIESNVYDRNYAAGFDSRNPLQCKICYAIFPKRFLLKEHHLRVHPQEKPYTCNMCSSAFKSNFLLSQHKLKHNRRDSIKCGQCSKYFRSQLHLQRHTKNFHLTSTYTCHICHEKFENYTQIRFQYHVRQHGEKRFQCQFCEKSFHQKVHLINHERTHTKEQPFTCDVCGKSYRQQTACREHMLTHEDPRPFKCKICQKGFTQRSSLRLHYRARHTSGGNGGSQKPFFHCELCGQNFTQKAHHELHKLSHANYCSQSVYGLETERQTVLKAHAQTTKVFKCQYCDKSFQKKQLQLLHEQQHHVEEDEDDHEEQRQQQQHFKCSFCNETFLYRSNLGKHVLSHLEEDGDNADDELLEGYGFGTSKIT